MDNSIVIVLITLGVFVAVSNSQSGEDFESSSEYANCTADYFALESAVFRNHNNIFKLTTTFFPPDKANPLYVTVTYSFSTTNVEYIWATTSLFLSIHPRIIRYLSLFFCFAEENRIIELELQLPDECSGLANTHAEPDFLYVFTQRLQLYAKTPGKAKLNSEYRASVTAVNDQRNHLAVNLFGERVFFSLPVVMPVISLLIFLIYIHGAHIYIRHKVKDPKQFPTIAALYWIGQTFSVFVIIMDILALKASHQHNSFFAALFSIIIPIEILSLLLSLVIVLISTFGRCSGVVNCLSKIYNRGILISQKETNIWSCISGFISPLICVSSHIGFVIGGWISFGERSISILLFYLFVFLILYWCLRQSYRVSVFLIDSCKGKDKIYASTHANTDLERQGGCEVHANYEAKHVIKAGKQTLETNILNTSHSTSEQLQVREEKLFNDFNLTALIIMIIAGTLLDVMLFYFGFGMLSLLTFFDDAVINVYTLVQYLFYFAVFLLTYGQFTDGPGFDNNRLNISTKTLRLWRYLCSGRTPKFSIESLQHAVKHLIFTLKTLEKASYPMRQAAPLNKRAKIYFDEAIRRAKAFPIALDESVDAALEQNVDVVPEESVDVAPEQSTDAVPEQSTDVAPEQSVDAALEQNVAPEESEDVAPEQSVDAAPKEGTASKSENLIRETAVKLEEAMKALTDGPNNYKERSTDNCTNPHITRMKQDVMRAEKNLQTIKREEVLSEGVKKAVMYLTKAVTILQNEAIKLLHSYNDLGIYNSRDKIEALRAALIFQKTSTFEHLEDNENLSLLMSLIET